MESSRGTMMQASFKEAAERGMWLHTEGIPEVIIWEGAPGNSSFYLGHWMQLWKFTCLRAPWLNIAQNPSHDPFPWHATGDPEWSASKASRVLNPISASFHNSKSETQIQADQNAALGCLWWEPPPALEQPLWRVPLEGHVLSSSKTTGSARSCLWLPAASLHLLVTMGTSA